MRADQTYYDIAVSRLDEQTERANGLDSKLATAFGFSAAILPTFGALLALAKHDRPHSAIVLYVVAMAVYIVMLGVAALAYRITKFSMRPDLETLKVHSDQHSDSTMRIWVGNECLLSIATNEPKLHRKAVLTTWALGLLALEAVLLTLAALVVVT
jgi:hypothetical protein